MKRTERRLEQGFVKILEDEPFNQLTVAELVEASQVSRRSFYTYYTDKYDFLAAIERRIFDGSQQELKKDRENIIKFQEPRKQRDEEKYLATQDEFYHFATFMLENKAVIRALFSTNGDATFAYKLGDVIKEELEKRNEFYQIDYATSIPKRYAEELYVGGIVNTFKIWALTPSDEKEETVDEFLDILGKMQIISPYHLFKAKRN
ncbi:transcriptional regulator, tetr family [Ligilactobacillus hayakitensis DSM 18933 = JCM 14209]|uniref:Transcriptional regulator, tetr family n=1 Tax=Ligilactobacillus hayakitensis DSM 18933 = JCM 14209 TaxID=1423755 RepID=A0A0R1WQ66_9LACO|nr:TetR/AcrR family transcriptional regulator [Ligilactobacillus hayakitensis]KRM20032.1 transcriptional regulator, tetr family [Ligilactobacillus hayakitensis DSM 18933 = JCM 14209]